MTSRLRQSNSRHRKYDWRIQPSRRWDISESRLAPGKRSPVSGSPTAWAPYSWRGIALITAVLLAQQAGLISGPARMSIVSVNFAEVQSRQRMAELAHVNRFSDRWRTDRLHCA